VLTLKFDLEKKILSNHKPLIAF